MNTKFSYFFAALLLAGCGSFERIDNNRADKTYKQNKVLIETQGGVAEAAIAYLAEKNAAAEKIKRSYGGKKEKTKKKFEIVREAKVTGGFRSEASCEIICRFCWDGCQEKCPVYYDDNFSGSGDCAASEPWAGWLFDGSQWTCDPFKNGLCPEGSEGVGKADQREHNIDIAIPQQRGQDSVANPIGNGNFAVQSSPGAVVNYNAGGSPESAEDTLLRAVSDFIKRDPVRPGRLSFDRALDTVPAVAKSLGDTAVKITGLGVLGSFASDAVQAAGDRYDTSGDFGSDRHDESVGSHFTTETGTGGFTGE